MYNQSLLHRLVILCSLMFLDLPLTEQNVILQAAHMPTHTAIKQQLRIALYAYLNIEGGINDYYDYKK